MADSTTTVAELKASMARFVAEREWEQFHSPKNLVMGLAVETAELMEHFLWIDNNESRQIAQSAEKRQEIADELADVTTYILALSNVLNLDMSDAVVSKMAQTAKKYPVEECRGRYQAPEQKNC